MEFYKKKLVNDASKLDSLTNASSNINKNVMAIIETNDEKSIKLLLLRISDIINNSYYNKDIKMLAKLVHSDLLVYFGYIFLQKSLSNENLEKEDKRTLDELLHDLNSLVGLSTVKSKINDLVAYQKVQKIRREKGLVSSKSSLHIAFMGNPGTGKTTVARIVGHIYKQIGLLSKGHFIEVSRTDLIAGYQGQTALKVKSVIDRAKGGVLFIDEAYSITENENSDSYGRECLTELTKALEDYRDDLVVIVAGYTEPMRKFFESNPGLKSRFNTFIEFPDYNVDELLKILESICVQNNYVIEEHLKPLIQKFFEDSIHNKNGNFANGRLVRNLFEDLVMAHARRVVNIKNPTASDLTLIIPSDYFYKS